MSKDNHKWKENFQSSDFKTNLTGKVWTEGTKLEENAGEYSLYSLGKFSLEKYNLENDLKAKFVALVENLPDPPC